jgi:DNA-binding NarL/FixJ family response regulator
MKIVMPLRVLVVDAHEVVREGVRLSLAGDARMEVVGVAASGREAVARAQRLLPDVALVDLDLPDMDGLEVCRRIRTVTGRRTRVVLVAAAASSDRIRAAVDAGAFAYVTKAAGLRALRDALDHVMAARRRGSDPDPSPAVGSLLRALRDDAQSADAGLLTRQQRRVLELASEGLTDRQIGLALCISESTVRYHVQRLKALLGARSKVDLVRRAYDAGIAGTSSRSGPTPGP